MIYRTIVCDKCGSRHEEKLEGMGFRGWGHVRGFNVDGVERDLHFCPNCLRHIKDLLETLKNEET